VVVPNDYHIEYDGHLYSVPHDAVHKTVDIRATATVIEVLHENRRIAVHARSRSQGNLPPAMTTVAAHMTPAHRAQHEWTLERVVLWSMEAGADIAAYVAAIVADRRHPQQAFRVCLGIKRLEHKVGRDRLNAACRRALALGSLGTAGVESILEHQQEQLPLPWDAPPLRRIRHENVRGPAYYRDMPADAVQEAEERHAASSHS